MFIMVNKRLIFIQPKIAAISVFAIKMLLLLKLLLLLLLHT